MTLAARATTKPFQFASPKDRAAAADAAKSAPKDTATTAAAAGGTTSGGSTSTTKAAAPQTNDNTTASDTTIMHDYVPSGASGAFSGGEVPATEALPPVRYLQKFVIDVLNSGSYTAKTEMVSDGIAIPITIYKNEDNMAYQMTVSDLMAATLQKEYSILGKVTANSKIGFIAQNTSSSNPKLYLTLPTGYIDMQDAARAEGSDFTADDLKGMFQDLSGGVGDIFTKEFSKLTYVESKGEGNYWRESYTSPDGKTGYDFYFTSRGLSRIDITDLASGEVQKITVELLQGVNDANAFKPSGKKMDMDAIQKFFEGLE